MSTAGPPDAVVRAVRGTRRADDVNARLPRRAMSDIGYDHRAVSAWDCGSSGYPDSKVEGRQPVRTLIATDVRLFEVGLRRALADRHELHVVGTAGDQAQALACVRDFLPDVVLLDMTMPGSLDIARAVARSAPVVQVVAFAVSERDDDVLACAEAGVVGYVTREGSMEQLIAVLRYVARGELLCSPRIAGSLFRRVARLGTPTAIELTSGLLTCREREVARLVARGLSNKEVAGELHIELSTVKNHVHHLLEKLRIDRRGKLVTALRGGTHVIGA